MSDVPSGWYDDPEDPSQYRYWDGAQWSEHRAPKSIPGAPRATADDHATAIVATGWNLFWRNWGPIAVITLVIVAGLVAVLVATIVLADQALDPGLYTIFERVSDPGFNPETDPADDAFVESISFDPNPVFWVMIPLLVLFAFVVQGFGIGAATIHLAAAHHDRPFTLGETFRVALSRLPRWIGVYILWTIALMVAFALAVLVMVISGAISPILLIVTIPAGIGLFVFAYPYLWLAPTALLVGRTDEPPFRTTAALVQRIGWGSVAAKVLLLNLVVIGISIALAVLGVIPLLGIIISIIGNAITYGLGAAMGVRLWEVIGGRFGADIVGDTEATTIN